MRPSKLLVIVYTTQWQPVFIFIISNLTFSMQWSLLPGWTKLSIPSTSFTPTARREPPSVGLNLLADPDTFFCVPFQQIPSIHNSWRTGHTRWGATSPVNNKVSDQGKVPTPKGDTVVSQAPSRQSSARKISGIRSYFSRINTPRRISSQILVMRCLHFLACPNSKFPAYGKEH